MLTLRTPTPTLIVVVLAAAAAAISKSYAAKQSTLAFHHAKSPPIALHAHHCRQRASARTKASPVLSRPLVRRRRILNADEDADWGISRRLAAINGDQTKDEDDGASVSAAVPAVAIDDDGKVNGEINKNDEAPSSLHVNDAASDPSGVIDEEDTEETELSEDELTMFRLPRHADHTGVNAVLTQTERVLKGLHRTSLKLQEDELEGLQRRGGGAARQQTNLQRDYDDGPVSPEHDLVYANSYVDLGKVDTVGFDYDYTLVTYTIELLDLIYSMALKRLVHDKQYPHEMLSAEANLKFDPFFSIRGLAVDRDTGWICHLSYTHRVAVAWEGRDRVSPDRVIAEYSGKRALRPSERRKRLKPLNDLFSMAECCLIADTVQFFKDRGIPFCPRNAVQDVLSAVTKTHISGDFHRLVAAHPERYFEPKPHLGEVLDKLKESGKRLIFVSNSPFWYVDAGMTHIIGPKWRDQWDAVIVSAGKPSFYTDDSRPFREVSSTTGRVKFKKVTKLEPGEVYTEGCLRELTRCLDWYHSPLDVIPANTLQTDVAGGGSLASPNVLYIGDSLFADLVDAKREFGWTTAAVTPEVGLEIELQSRTRFVLAQRTIDILLNCLRLLQTELGSGPRSHGDLAVMDALERLVSRWREEQNNQMGNPFGSVFRAKFQPSLFAHSLRRYCDLYMNDVGSLRHYSPQHRFYPNDARLLSHEIRGSDPECWDLDDVLAEGDSSDKP